MQYIAIDDKTITVQMTYAEKAVIVQALESSAARMELSPSGQRFRRSLVRVLEAVK